MLRFPDLAFLVGLHLHARLPVCKSSGILARAHLGIRSRRKRMALRLVTRRSIPRSAQPSNPLPEHRELIGTADVDDDGQADARVPRTEAELLAKAPAEMSVADEPILVSDLADAARLLRVVEEDVNNLEPTLADIGSHA